MSSEARSPGLSGALSDLAISRDDEKAWREMYDALWPYVFGIVYRALGGKVEPSKDLSQDVFVRVFLYCPFDQLSGEGALRAYVRTVANNEVRRFYSRGRESADVSLEQIRASLEKTRDALNRDFEEVESRDVVERELADLSQEEQELLLLLIRDMAVADIAAQLGISEGATSSRIYRLRTKLANTTLGPSLRSI